jgi:Cu+-exporting ATPase
MNTQEFKIKGMHCASCVMVVERSVKKQKGVAGVIVNLATESATVQFDPELLGEKEIVKAIESKGYKVVKERDKKGEKRIAALKFVFALAFTLPVFILSMFVPHGTIPFQMYIILALATPVQFVSGFEFYRKSIDALKGFNATMDTLVALGTSAAYFYSIYLIVSGHGHHLYFETSSVLITVILLGRFLESQAKQRASDAIQKLIDFTPKRAVVIRSGIETETIVNDIEKGDIVVVKPGEKICVDGIITEGFTSMDVSVVTGESIPVEKKPGDMVLAGSINKEGSIRFRAEKVGSETTLAQMITLIERAQASKPPVQKMADSVSSVFVPVVIIIAAVTFSLWMTGGHGFEKAISAAVAVLVVACPCALGLATPAAVLVSSGRASAMGILVKDASALELAGKTKIVVFDKTGTITQGRPEITEISEFAAAGIGQKSGNIFLALEKKSEHPLAAAVVEKLRSKGYGTFDDALKADNFINTPGRGIEGEIDGVKYFIGNAAFISEKGIETGPFLEKINALEVSGKTVMILADAAHCIGYAAAEDPVKTESRGAVELLLKEGISVYMITGDNERTANAVARLCGIENVIAGATPLKKEEKVRMLKKDGGTVIFAGDGINDAPALAASDVGIAFASGTDIAAEAGSVVLMKNNPADILKLIKLSRATTGKIRQNLFWAFFYNVIGIPVAAFGMLNPMIAGTAMAMSSVSVLANSLMLKKIKIS